MIATIIRCSINNRFLVLLASIMIIVLGIGSLSKIPLDALPDISDVQVIIRTTYPGQAPQIIENQITYPISTTMLSVPGAKTVRGYSFFGDSFVYVLFDDDTDIYWARSRVLEYLNQVQTRLPAQAKTSLGPDATGVGWIYEYALIDRSSKLDISELRALQDWFLKYELKTVANVAEVASVGGMVRQYQVVLDPNQLRAYNITHSQVIAAIQQSNQDSGGSVLELAEAEYMVRSSGYLKSINDFRKIPLKIVEGGISIQLKDVATIQIGPEMRRGIAELNGEGEVAGGIIVMRSGANALETINAVKDKLNVLKASLPPGVEIISTYDRSDLIIQAIKNLKEKLFEEFIVVAFVCALFLFHIRSAFVAIIALPLGILAAFIVMQFQGINANIMSLGGIAIAIGAMVDAAIVMIENVHKHLEEWQKKNPNEILSAASRWNIVTTASAEVGPALFYSLLIITLSFIPVFTLEAQEGRLFSPLAFTKTYAMAAAAILSITLIPVLMGYCIRGKIPQEHNNPIIRGLKFLYNPALNAVLRFPKLVFTVLGVISLMSFWPITQLGSEFMPPLDEGDILYMPSALPGISVSKVSELIQQTDRMIKTIPEVKTVFGKAGRAETATDPAPLEMFETTIQFKPKNEWRPGMTSKKLLQELDALVQVPGLTNIWVSPIRNRIDMLATGIKSPVGIKVSGDNIKKIDLLTNQIVQVIKKVPGVSSALAEQLNGGRYLDIEINRNAAARYGLNVSDIQSIVSSAIGGENIGEFIDGLQRFPINVRYPREIRDSISDIKNLPILTEQGAQIRLADVTSIKINDDPPMLRSENARLAGWIYVDIQDRDLKSAVKEMQEAVNKNIQLPQSYSLTWSGQFEFLERATAKFKIVIPATLGIIFFLLFLTFKRLDEALLISTTLPFALIGGIWLLWLLDHHISVASGVGFIALAGVSAEFGVIMLLYLKNSWQQRIAVGKNTNSDLLDAIREGAVQRVRPKAMTVAVIIAGLLPIMFGTGVGSEVMQRIAAPMIGGMITAPLISMFVIPIAFYLMNKNKGHTLRV
ncbi:MAG: efflux RND transporter permease subunit [Pseudomonadota bacterium]